MKITYEDRDDSDNCTTDVCSDGVCSYTPFSCPEEGEECMDGVCVPQVCDNNGVCESGEDCNNCPNDCLEDSGAVCGNGVCETSDGEECQSCPDDCNGILTGKPGDRYCCGSSGQYGSTCADARYTGSGNTCSSDPAVSTCCGDGVCEGAEDLGNCRVDCACTGSENCDDPACECISPGASCTQDSDCCSNKCLGKPETKTCK